MNNQKSICHIISGDLWAGAEVMAYHLLTALQEQNTCNLYVILLNTGKLTDELQKKGIDVFVINEKSNSFLQIVKKARAFITKQNISVIHSHRYKENLIAFLVTLGKPGIRLIATQHGMPEQVRKKLSVPNAITKLNFYILSTIFKKTVVVSQDMHALLVKYHGFKSTRLAVVHNGIPLPPKIWLDKPLCEFVIGTSGRLFPVKDFCFFVEIAKELHAHKNIRFVIAGEGPERAKIEKKIIEYKLQNSVTLLGHVENVDSFYNSLHVYVNTSVHEGIPMTILEAMGKALPIIAPKIGGIPEIVNNECEGFIVDKREPEEFAKKIIMLYHNADRYALMSMAARAHAEKDFSAKAMGAKYLDLYTESI